MASVNLDAAQQRYSSVAIVLHWLLALGIAFQLALGFAMPKGPAGFDEFQLHKSVGITILLLTLVRIAWRLTHRPPPPAERGLGFVAKAVHTGFYVFLIAMPLSGWAVVSTSRIEVPTIFWGMFEWPHLPLSRGLNETAEQVHELLAWLGIALFLLHVAGVIRHQLLLRDGLLKRMAPAGSVALAGLLALLVVVVYFATGMKVAGDAVAAGAYAQPAGRMSREERVPLEAAPEANPTPEAEETATAEEEEAAEAGPPPVWTIQPGGRLGFAVEGNGMTARGSFSEWNGQIRFDPENPDSADIRITVRLASASLGDATMDATLQGEEFFASAVNPTATWRSTSVRRTGPNRYSANGTLSLKGASRPQSVNFTLSGEGLRRRVEGSATIDRTAFAVGTGEAAQGMGSSVSLSFAFDAVGRQP